MQDLHNPNHIKVGDRVIDFRGEKRGVVMWMSADGRHCAVQVQGVDGQREYFPRVWRKLEEE